MGMVIEDDLLRAARMSEPEIKLELAALLYQRERLTLGLFRFHGLDVSRWPSQAKQELLG